MKRGIHGLYIYAADHKLKKRLTELKGANEFDGNPQYC